MGRKPQLPTAENEELVGTEAMSEALDSLLAGVEDGSIKGSDYFVKFVSANLNKHAGSCEKVTRQSPKLTFEMYAMVQSAFEDVENGNLNAEGYYFELTTQYFQYKSGCYPQKQKDGNAYLDDSEESESFNTSESIPDRWTVDAQADKLSEVECLRKMKEKLLRPRKDFCIRLWTSWSSINVVLVLSVVIVQTVPSVASEAQALELTAGENGIILFECRNRQPLAPKYYTVKFEEKDRPFFIDGNLDPEGLMSPDQADRFRVEYLEKGSAMFIEINIAHVTAEDQGTYIVFLIVQGETHEYHEMKTVVVIFIPPGPASCYLKRNENVKILQLSCHSKPGNGDSTLTCFQKGEKILYQSDGEDTQIVYERIFWLLDADSLVSCCSHDVKYIHTIRQTSCNQYIYPGSEISISPTPQSSKIPSEIAYTRNPFSMEEKNKKPPSETRAYSGCGRNVDWAFSMLSIASLFTYLCVSNP